ncbi:MAG: ornithine cyclodeaminase family protein [Pseudomonadales bacterium]
MKFVSGEEIQEKVSFPDLISALKIGFAAASITAPLRHHHSYPNPAAGADSTLLLMPAWTPGESLGVKLVTISPRNDRIGMPSVQGVYVLFDAANGEPKLLLDAKVLTTMRTAAASALASTFLSRPDSRTLLMIGTGALAPQLIRAHAAVRPIELVYLWGRERAKAESLADMLGEERFSVVPVESVSERIAAADIVSCATLSSEPLIDGKVLVPGQHVDLVGSFQPDMREADDATISRCSVFVDHYEGALTETGDIVIPLASGVLNKIDLNAELTQLCRGDHVGRKGAEELTLFKSVGHALEDLVAASLLHAQLAS